jgi:hypothetical protein
MFNSTWVFGKIGPKRGEKAALNTQCLAGMDTYREVALSRARSEDNKKMTRRQRAMAIFWSVFLTWIGFAIDQVVR